MFRASLSLEKSLKWFLRGFGSVLLQVLLICPLFNKKMGIFSPNIFPLYFFFNEASQVCSIFSGLHFSFLGSCEVCIYFKGFSEKAAYDFLIFYDNCLLQTSNEERLLNPSSFVLLHCHGILVYLKLFC